MAAQTPNNPFQTIIDSVAGQFTADTGAQTFGRLPVPQTGSAKIVPNLPDLTGKNKKVPLLSYIEEKHKLVEAAGEHASQKNVENLRKAGAVADGHLHTMQGEVAAAKEALTKEHVRLLNSKGADAKALGGQYKASLAKLEEYEKVLVEQRTELQGKAKHSLVGGKAEFVAPEKAGSAVGGAAAKGAKIFLSNKAEAAKLGVIGEKAYNELSWGGKRMAELKAGINVSKIEKTGEIVATTLPGKAMKAGGTALGVIIGGYGLKDLGQAVGVIGPDTDEQGKELPTDGKLFKAAAELGAAAGAVYLSVMRGGGAKAMGAFSR